LSAARLRWAEIDLGALAHNVVQLRATLRPGTGMIAVVKANAYGHGAVDIGRAATAAGADWLAVATFDEAAELRTAGIEAPVLVMGPVAPGGEPEAVALDLRLCVYERESLDRLAAAAAASGRHVRLHLKVDTGMARLGCSPDEALLLARRIEEDPLLELEGLWTHFAEADDAGSSRTQQQLQAYLAVLSELASAGISPPILHCANSAAALLFPSTHMILVRVGLPLYGYRSSPGIDPGLDLRPVLAWKGRVVALRDLAPGDRVGYGGTFTASRPTRLATISMGYADGFSRALGGRATVLVAGSRAPVVGRVSMDYVTVDVTGIAEVDLGREVVFIGDDGGEAVDADDLARLLGTISWEILTMIGPRVERVVVGEGSAPVSPSVSEKQLAV
jgi:alanine racemase